MPKPKTTRKKATSAARPKPKATRKKATNTARPKPKATRKKATNAARPKPKATRKKATNAARPKPKRRNSDQSAADQLYTDFHGTEPTRHTEYSLELEYRDKLAKLGKLLNLGVYTPNDEEFLLTFSGPIEVCAEPGGNQLYFVGGNQKQDLAAINIGEIERMKDHVVLGECQLIEYHTRKGFHDFEPTDYHHFFGEEGGHLPILNYDTQNQLLYLTGGSYQVRPEGIVN